jgi:NitT/TauT family transport system ATP-binding protein
MVGKNMSSGDSAGAIALRNADFQFSPGTPLILKNFNLEVRPGEFFVLLGPSGCGKTTVLNIQAGFERVVRGEALAGKQSVRGPGRDRAVVFQDSDSLYTWLTALENVEFPLRVAGIAKKERRVRAREALRLVGLEAHGHKYPSQLSGGMKQRTQLARALVLDSPILLMDEPFAALDAQTRSLLQDDLMRISMRTERTILFITHDIAEAITLADRIGVMTAGPESFIKQIFEVTLPRPRRRGSAAFGELYDQIQAILADEVQQALRREDSRK